MFSPKKETSDTSPVLFLNGKGEPMRFYIRPGPSKVQLHPLITNGGGVLCRTQEPGSILLADPAEISGAVEGVGQFYISTQYILDCVTQNQQLDIERYRFINLQPVQTRKASQKKPGMGRMSYSHEDDMAILKFIDGHRHDAKGNRIWQQMERQRITSHSWQSMKDRFLKHLQHKQASKSPRKAKKASPLTESSLSDETSTPKQKASKKAAVVLSSDSDSTQISQGDEQPDQQEPGSSSKRSRSPQRPGSETIQLHHKDAEPHGDQDQDQDQDQGQGLLSEKEQQQNDQQPEVSNKRARTDSDSREDALQGPNEQSPAPSKRKKGRKTSERKLSILKRAAREFEDSQTIDNGSQETQSQSRASSYGSDTDEAQIMAARARALSDPDVNTEKQHAAQAQSDRNLQRPEDDGKGPGSAAVPITSNAHLFLFQESQEDLSQPSEENTQSLLEVEQHVGSLMQKTKKDLVEVMKALLKASGDTTLALSFLLEEYDPEVHGPIWTKYDDETLLSGDSSERELLVDKYGAESVSRRVAFLTED